MRRACFLYLVCVIAIISTAKTTTRIPVYSAGYVGTPLAETPERWGSEQAGSAAAAVARRVTAGVTSSLVLVGVRGGVVIREGRGL